MSLPDVQLRDLWWDRACSPDPALTWVHERHADSVVIEIVPAIRFQTMRDAWDDLTQRACEPNPFMDPAIVSAAAFGNGAKQTPVLLAWRRERLVGVWAFSRSLPSSRMPLTVLAVPLGGLIPNATPVIDADHVVAVLSAMLDAIARAPDLPKLLSMDMLNDGGPVMEALQQVFAARKCPLVVLGRTQRPVLNGRNNAADHLKRMISGRGRRQFNWQRRRLASRGRFLLVVHRERDPLIDATERFIKLEASGWKAQSGRSEAERIRYRAFLRNAVESLAGSGRIEAWEYLLDDSSVSLALFLRHQSGAYCWKIAYDERHRDCSPGALLALDYTAAFLGDAEIALADSCASDDAGIHSRFWDERQPMIRLIADVRSGGSLAFTLWAAFEIRARKIRPLARAIIQSIRQRMNIPGASIASPSVKKLQLSSAKPWRSRNASRID